MLKAIGDGFNRLMGAADEAGQGVTLTPYEAGHKAGLDGTNEANPYPQGDPRHAPWQAGYDEGREAWVM